MKLEGFKAPEPGHSVRVAVDGTAVAVFNIEGKLFAIDVKCTHVGGPLDQGRLEGDVVSCPWHGSQFDVKSGAVLRGPAIKPVRAYKCSVDGGNLVLDPA